MADVRIRASKTNLEETMIIDGMEGIETNLPILQQGETRVNGKGKGGTCLFDLIATHGKAAESGEEVAVAEVALHHVTLVHTVDEQGGVRSKVLRALPANGAHQR